MTKVMRSNEESGSLVIFTTLAPLAAGGLVGLLVTHSPPPPSGIDQAAMLVLSVGILALVVSTFHLGRPWRAPLAMLRLATSWLSREVILFGMFLLFLAAYAILPAFHFTSLGVYSIGWIGAIIGLAATVATGETYRLHARPSWDQGLTLVSFLLGALSTGLMFGLFAAYQFSGVEAPLLTWVISAVILLASLAVTLLRSTSLHPHSAEARFSRDLVLGAYAWLLAVRVIAVLGHWS
jgi:anaerobic dimethyl sulfoxide reductase subunit C (anchor subunit)